MIEELSNFVVFKQKTAYEMRISDWSSDVCSSDLMFITSGVRADFVTTVVRTGEDGHGGLSLIVVEKGAPGFTVSKSLKKMGWWCSDTAELSYDRSDERRIGKVCVST